MLKSLFELIAVETNDPDGYRSAIRKQLLEIVDTMPLTPMAAAREKNSAPSSRRQWAIY
jgi:hypothetical protein